MKKSPLAPGATVERLVGAINQADIEVAESLYEIDAVFVPEPGKVVIGRKAIRDALSGFMSLKPRLVSVAQNILMTGDVALYTSRWTMDGIAPDGSAVRLEGVSSDVLRRQSDGAWLISIDNPYGAGILDSR